MRSPLPIFTLLVLGFCLTAGGQAFVCPGQSLSSDYEDAANRALAVMAHPNVLPPVLASLNGFPTTTLKPSKLTVIYVERHPVGKGGSGGLYFHSNLDSGSGPGGMWKFASGDTDLRTVLTRFLLARSDPTNPRPEVPAELPPEFAREVDVSLREVAFVFHTNYFEGQGPRLELDRLPRFGIASFASGVERWNWTQGKRWLEDVLWYERERDREEPWKEGGGDAPCLDTRGLRMTSDGLEICHRRPLTSSERP